MAEIENISILKYSAWQRFLRQPARVKNVPVIKLPNGFCDINRNYHCGRYRIEYSKFDYDLRTGLYIKYADSKYQLVHMAFTDDDLIKNSDGVYLKLKHMKRICSRNMRYELEYDQVKTGDLVVSFVNSIKFTVEVDENKIVTECINELNLYFQQ